MSSGKYTTHLQSFIASSSSFKILNATSHTTNALYILDSSFNPPTKAHLALAMSSLPQPQKSAVLLLLALQNADKAPKPATFDQRLEMMDILARKIEDTLLATALIALTKHARFVDKAKDVAASFPSVENFVWLVGYDTLIRILDNKYYSDTLEESLGEFWERNRFVCAIRGDETVERGFVDRIRAGELNGVPPSWAEYIEIVDPVGRDDSSTRAREAAVDGKWDEVRNFVPEEITAYIQKKKLYSGK